MSADLKMLVGKKRAEIKAHNKKMAEFEKRQTQDPDATLAHNVKTEKQALKATNKVMQELKHKN